MHQSDDTIFLLSESGDLEKMPREHYDSEELLQSLIERYPELLAGDQIGAEEPVRWLLVSREAGVPDGEQRSDRWAVDHLLLDQHATPTFVETKRSSDTRIRREVVGQMLDYAANAERYWPAERIRALASGHYKGADRADAAIVELLGLDSGEDTSGAVEDFWTSVETNLRSGRIRLLFVADELPRELRRIIEFLNEQMSRVEVLGVELPQYVGANLRALVPRLIGQTESIRQQKKGSKPSPRRTTRQQFLDGCPDNVREYFDRVLAEANRRGMTIYWGTKGFSLRAQKTDSALASIFYGYPPGAHGRETAFIQGYVGYFEDNVYREEVRRRFLAINGVVQQGKYTLDLSLDSDSLDAAEEIIEVVWMVAGELAAAGTLTP